MKNQKVAYFYAVSAVLIWSTVASAFKISLQYLDFLQLLLISALVSTFVLTILLIIKNKIKELTKYSLKEYLRSALLGFLNPFLYYILLFKAYSILPAQEAQPLNYTWPIMLVLLSIPLLNQKVNLKSIIAIIISFFGVLTISTQGDILGFGFTNLYGAILALSTAIIWALFWIFNKKDKRDEIPKLFLSFAFGFLYIFIATISFSEIKIPKINGLLGACYVGFFEMGITFVIWSKALELSITTAKVSNLIYLVPFLSLVIIFFVLGEDILISTIIGLVFIVIGIILEQLKLTKKNA
ncbi:DMT family transporter [uncultured Algibacter sp.]|uniref:DMT family transporter n=1 Tax=uncultured Algibacter sp. TaxID=298659 RepID=UPI00260DDFC4|nr:DMT family transporter [uncultured Algibacter sp.]